jgi:methyl-accepting chemotaxis protein
MKNWANTVDDSYIFTQSGSERELARLLQSCSKILGVVVASLGFVVILGWIFDLPVLKSILPGLVTMKANAAICFILGGVSLWLWHKNRYEESNRVGEQQSDRSFNSSKHLIIQVFAILMIAIALLTLMQYVFNINLGIDQLLFKESLGAVNTTAPGRMAPNTAWNFLLFGSALLLLSLPQPNYLPAQLFSLLAFLIAFLGFLGYIYGNSYFYNPGFYTAMALHTSVGFLLSCLGILFACPNKGVMAVLTAQNAGGLMARRLCILAILVPSSIGWLILSGYHSKAYTSEMAISLLSILNVIIFTVLIWWNAKNLGSIDEKRFQSELALKQAFETAKQNSKEKERIAMQLKTAVNEVTITMEQLRASSRVTAEQAEAADDTARQALTLSSQGKQAVEETQEGMKSLQESVAEVSKSMQVLQQQTSQIGNISSLVSDLASQTNMLALNAAVEAVRAGEHGKGFAVVAAEIRKLADQSKMSAQKISTLVADIQKANNLTAKASDRGTETAQLAVKIATKTANAFRGVAQAIDRICANNQQIALTAKEQALVIEQVVNAMNAIDQ